MVAVVFLVLAMLLSALSHARCAPFPTALPYQWQCTITQTFGSMNYSLVYEEYGALGSNGASTSWFWYSMYQTIGRYGNRQTAEFTQLAGTGVATDPYYYQPYYARYSIASTSTAETCYGVTPVQLGYLAWMHSRAIWTTLGWAAIAWTDGGSVSVPERETQGNVWTSNTLLILTQDGSVCLANASCWVNGSSPFFSSPASLLSGPAFHLQELVDMGWLLGQGSWQSNITSMAAYVRPYTVSDEMPLANWTNSQIPVRVVLSGVRQNLATGLTFAFTNVFDWSNYQPLTSSLVTYSGCLSNYSALTAPTFTLPLPTASVTPTPATVGASIPLTDLTSTFTMVVEGQLTETGNTTSIQAARSGASSSFVSTLGSSDAFAMSWLYASSDSSNNYGRSSEVTESWDYTADTFRNYVYYYENLTLTTALGGFADSDWVEPTQPGPGYAYLVNGVGNGSAVCLGGTTSACWTCSLQQISSSNQNPLRVLHGGALWKLMSNPGDHAFSASCIGSSTLRGAPVDVYQGTMNIASSSGWVFNFQAILYLYQSGWNFPGRQALTGSGVDPAFASSPLRMTAVGTAYPPYWQSGYSSFTFNDTFDIFDLSPDVIDYNYFFDITSSDGNVGYYQCPSLPAPAALPAAPSVAFPSASLPYQWSATVTQSFTSLNYTLSFEEYLAIDAGGSETFYWYDMFQTVGRYNSRYISEFTQIAGCAVSSVCSSSPYNTIPYKPYFQQWDTNADTCTNYPVNLQYLAYMHSRAIWTTLGDFPYIVWQYNGVAPMTDRQYSAQSWSSSTLLILTFDGSVCLASGACTPNNGTAFYGSPAQGVLTPPLWPLQELVDMNFAVDSNRYQSNITSITAYALTGSTAYSLLANWGPSSVLPIRIVVSGQRVNLSSGSSAVQPFQTTLDWSNVQPLWDNIPASGGCTQATSAFTAPLPTSAASTAPSAAAVGSALPVTAFSSNSFTAVVDWNSTQQSAQSQFSLPGQPVSFEWWYQQSGNNPLGGASEAVQLWNVGQQGLSWLSWYYSSASQSLGYRYHVLSFTNTSNANCGNSECFNCSLTPITAQQQSNPLSWVRGGALYALLTSASSLSTSLTATGSSLMRGVLADRYSGTVGSNTVTVWLYPAGWQFPGRQLNGVVDSSAARSALCLTVTNSSGVTTDVFDLFDYYPTVETVEGNDILPYAGDSAFGCPAMPTTAPTVAASSSSSSSTATTVASASSSTASPAAATSSSQPASSSSAAAATSPTPTSSSSSSSAAAATSAAAAGATSSISTTSSSSSSVGDSVTSTGSSSSSSSSNNLALGLGLGLGLGGGLCLLLCLILACLVGRSARSKVKGETATGRYTEHEDRSVRGGDETSEVEIA